MSEQKWRDPGPRKTGHSLASFDIHGEVLPSGASHIRDHRTAFDKDRENSKIVFNKTIEGRYRDGKVGYEEVGVLLLTWEDDDMYCSASEVPDLEEVFRKRFGFKTRVCKIPSERSQTSLHRTISDFAYDYDSPNKMSIIYYGGHADFVNERLQLFA